ncbi:transcriptional regulator AraC family [Cupriavidus necator N-1]|jgi:hypothetical protein|uniref:Transcriptional regulator AraC family n=1 Tax=Cupriavidus necator (strain ATCC 43291 / DSM 13513 / CCUG 52238 / LMG 8453 / N-1) TaxID=1042878 RepID=F8GMF0_CUPNN|nr:transcriptional regulator AraC family [Cupriavidus necator N-1]KAI3611565.1 Transcriptional regulator, AraC family [Cupriavidus necator H850]
MSYYLRSASLTNYVEVARSLGLDPYQQLRAAKINRSVLLDPDIRIPAASVGGLLTERVFAVVQRAYWMQRVGEACAGGAIEKPPAHKRRGGEDEHRAGR